MKTSGFVLLIAVLAAVGASAAPRVSVAQGPVKTGVRVPLPPRPPLPPHPSLPPLPRLVFPAPPAVVVVPETNVYVVPDAEVDIVFYHGSWYRPHGDRWYRAASYNGPWKLLMAGQVPSTFKKLPPGFRSVKPERERIPYQQVKKNWKQWEKEQKEDDSRAPGRGKGPKK